MEHVDRNKKRRKLERRRRNERRVIKILILIVILFLGWYGISPVKHLIAEKMVRYETVKWGVLEQKFSVKSVVIRDEKVIASPARGEFVPAVTEGSKVPVGTVIGYIKTQSSTQKSDSVKISVKTAWAGLVSFHPDGFETLLKPDMLNDFDMDKVSQLLDKGPEKVEKNTFMVDGGEIVAKIVDNLVNPFFFVNTSLQHFAPMPKVGDKISVYYDSSEKKTAKITDVRINGEEMYLMIQLDEICDPGLNTRFCELVIVPASYEGMIVPNEALVHKEGLVGVYVPFKGLAKFIKVDVTGIVGEQAVVDGLDLGSRIVVNPAIVKEGQRLE